MPTITYRTVRHADPTKINVLLDGKVTGSITHHFRGWGYKPKGARFESEKFQTLDDCKRSLEGNGKDEVPDPAPLAPAPRFALDAGRVIQIDGVPSCYISTITNAVTGSYGMVPANCDNLAHRIVDLLNTYGWTPKW